MNFIRYYNELKRRNVIKSALAYLVVAWVITQVLTTILTTFEAPEYLAKTVIVILIIGFPLWLIFAWVYEITPEGIKKTKSVAPESSITPQTSNRLNKIIIGALVIAIVLLAINLMNPKEEATPNPIEDTDIGSTTNENSIAVLAFADMSPEKNQEYFSDGISEEILNILVRIPNLKVISRTSSFSYKNKDLKATEIGQELNVSHILEGSIRKAGNTIRITAQLIKTDDGSHEWSHTYDRSLDSIFKVQDEIAGEVSNQLEFSLMGQANSKHEPNPEAYNLYLQAKHLTYQNTKESYLLAEDLLKQSIAIDSSYSNSWDLLGSVYNTGTYNFSIGDANESNKKGIVAVKKAIALNPNYADAYATLASLQERAWAFDDSERNLQKALELQPNNAVLIGTAALVTYGDIQKSIRLLKTAIDMDPLVYTNFYNLGFAYYRLNRLDEAMVAFNTFSTYYPNTQIVHYMKSKVLLAQGLKEEALIEIEKETHEFFSLYGKNFVHYALYGTEGADEVFKAFLDKYGESDPANTADLYAFRGDYDMAFKYLEKALDIKDAVLLEAMSYPAIQPMYKDSRWMPFIEKIGLPDNHGYRLK